MENKIKEIKKSNKKEFTRGVIITVCLCLASGLLGATITKRLEEEQSIESSLYAGISKEINDIINEKGLSR